MFFGRSHSTNVETELALAGILIRLNQLRDFKLVVRSAIFVFSEHTRLADVQLDAVDHLVRSKRTRALETFVHHNQLISTPDGKQSGDPIPQRALERNKETQMFTLP